MMWRSGEGIVVRTFGSYHDHLWHVSIELSLTKE